MPPAIVHRTQRAAVTSAEASKRRAQTASVAPTAAANETCEPTQVDVTRAVSQVAFVAQVVNTDARKRVAFRASGGGDQRALQLAQTLVEGRYFRAVETCAIGRMRVPLVRVILSIDSTCSQGALWLRRRSPLK